MTEDIENGDKKIVQSGPHGLVKSSSGLVRRGLDDLLLRSEQKSVEENSVGFWLQRGCDLIEEAFREEPIIPEPNQGFKGAPQRAEALSCYEKAIEIDANCKEAWVLRASCLEGLWRWRETVESLDKAIELIRAGTADFDPRQWHRPPVSHVAALSEARVSRLLERSSSDAHQLAAWKGRLLNDLGEFEEAIRCHDLALELSPDELDWDLRGRSLHHLGRYQEAIQCFDRDIAMLTMMTPEPEDWWRSAGLSLAWNSKGESLYRLGCWRESIECLDMAILYEPESWYVWYNKGNCFRKMKNFDEAIRCYDKAIEITSEHTARSWNYKSMCLRELGRIDEAISCDEKVMSCRLHLFSFEAALCLESEGRTKAAMDAYQAYLAHATPDEATPREMIFIEEAHERLQALKLRLEVNGQQDKYHESTPRWLATS